jgi:hypothetical protein
MGDQQDLLHKTLNVNGFAFDAISMGPESGECVLLLHGFPQFADAWMDAMRSISEAGFQAVAIDQRGYSPGARPAAVEDYTVDRLASDLLGFADVMACGGFILSVTTGEASWRGSSPQTIQIVLSPSPCFPLHTSMRSSRRLRRTMTRRRRVST